MTDELLSRINELARKKRTEGITSQEQEEQQQLYQLYLSDVRQQAKNSLAEAGYKPLQKN